MKNKLVLGHLLFEKFKNISLISTVTAIMFLLGTVALSASIVPDSSFKPVSMGSRSVVTKINQRPGGKIVISGGFIVAGGKRENQLAVLNADGTADSSFDFNEGVSNSFAAPSFITTHAAQNDNKILIAGNFNRINNVVRNGLARLNADGSVDTSFDIGSGFSGSIYAIQVLPTGKILVGGNFSTLNSQTVGSLVRLNSDGTLDNSFGSSGIINGNQIQDISVQQDNKIIIVSAIIVVNGTERRGIARLNEDGSLDATFDPGTGTTSGVNSVALQNDGKILIGGSFTTFNGVSQRGIVRLNSNGSIDSTFTASLNTGSVTPTVYDVKIQSDGKILIGGNFSNVNSVSRRQIARVNADGSIDTSFTAIIDNTNSPSSVQDILILADQTILIGGDFESVNQKYRAGIAALNSDGTLANSFDQGTGDVGRIERMVKQPDGKMVVAGGFTHIDGIFRRGVARLNQNGSIDTSFNSGNGIVGYVSALAVQSDGKIIIGGDISSYNGVGRGNITRINPDGSLDTSFPQGVTLNSSVLDIIIQNDNKIIVVGTFFRGIMRLNPDGTQDTSFNPGTGISGSINSVIQQPDGKIIIGGSFNTYNGTTRKSIARLNPDGSLDITFNPMEGASAKVSDVALQQDGKIIAAGDFTTFNNIGRNRIVKLNSDGSVDLTFDPGTGADATVNTIILQPDGKIILGGDFNTFNNTVQDRLSRIYPSGTLDLSFAPNLDFFYADQLQFGARIFSLVLEENNLFVGGLFSKINGAKWASLVKFTNVVSSSIKTPFDFDGDGRSDVSVFRPSNGVWYLNQSQNGFAGITFGQNGDLTAPADYDGDGKTDVAVFRPSNGTWYYLKSSDNSFAAVQFGQNGDLPRPADFDGDGKADISVFRASNGAWYRLNSSNGSFFGTVFGQNGDKPLIADFDGDGKSDLAVFRPANATFYWTNSSNNSFNAAQFGLSTDIPTPGDYDGDGKTDIAVFRGSNGVWYRLNSSNGAFAATQFGQNGDIPVTGDYDGDGKTDIAVFRASAGNWYYLNSSNGGFVGVNFGVATDRPVPAAFQN